MLKRALISSAVAMTFAAQPAIADDHDKEFDNWVAGFVQWYNADSNKPEPTGFFTTGTGVGAEFGLRIDKDWAARFEIARHQIRVDPFRKSFGAEERGTSYGADMVYFLDHDAAYVFGGARQQNLEDNYFSLAAGVGKHWVIAKELRIVTEAAMFHDLDNGFNDFGLKLGLAYAFGGSSASPAVVADKDSDNDGVMDSRDQCPNTPRGTAVDATGCNNDLDGDGVINSLDQCPNTPRGTAVNAVGCPLAKDSDGDGVYDDMDKCPETPRGDKVDASGCTEFTENEVSVSLNVLFANDSAVVENPSDAKIVEFAEFLKRFGNTSVSIEGHSSAVGPADYNLGLSQRRAKAVVDVLVNRYGIDRSRLGAVGYGETQLLNTANTAEAHRVNRRIEARVSASVKEKLTK